MTSSATAPSGSVAFEKTNSFVCEIDPLADETHPL